LIGLLPILLNNYLLRAGKNVFQHFEGMPRRSISSSAWLDSLNFIIVPSLKVTLPSNPPNQQ
jgi:hypothetical protein